MSEGNNVVEEGSIVMGSKTEEVFTCHECQKEVSADERYSFQADEGEEVYLCADCMEKIRQLLEEETKNPNIGRAVIFGTLTAFVGSFIWFLITIFTKMSIGILAVVLGWLIGTAVCIGAGHKKGQQLQVISASIMTIFLLAAEYMIYLYFVYLELQKEGASLLGVMIAGIMGIGDMIGGFISFSVSPVGLAIWAFGIYAAFAVPKPRKI